MRALFHIFSLGTGAITLSFSFKRFDIASEQGGPSFLKSFFFWLFPLWTKMENLIHLPFGIKLCLDIGFVHTTGLLWRQISQINWKRPKKTLKDTGKARHGKFWIFIIFTPNYKQLVFRIWVIPTVWPSRP